MKTLTKELQTNMTPTDAVNQLKEGNQRFIANQRLNRDLKQQVKDTATGQFPYATILSCIDSRAPAELVFDQGIGDVFNVRIAGNVVNHDILGSMEFACQVAGSKLIVVLGHRACGAVKGACDHVELGNLTGLLDKIKPAVEKEETIKDNRNSSNSEFVDLVATINIKNAVQDILAQSETLKSLVDQGKIKLVGALYDVATGKVGFLED